MCSQARVLILCAIVLTGLLLTVLQPLSFGHSREVRDAGYVSNQSPINNPGLIFSSYFGGSDEDAANAIAVDRSGNIYVTGETYSSNFVTASPQQANYRGSGDTFITFIGTQRGKSSPKITGAEVSHGTLTVFGEGFHPGAVIVIEGKDQTGTTNDQIEPVTKLSAPKTGKKIKAGLPVTLQVRNPDGGISPEFSFTR